MKKVKINWNGALSPVNTVYENAGVKFSWMAPGEEKGSFSQVTNWHGCRETFAGEICKFVGTTLPSRWTYKRQLDLKKTRVAVVRKHSKASFVESTKEDLKWMKSSTRILNILERTQGWSLTRVSICDDPDLIKHSLNTFVFVSSVKWMQSPQLLSLYLLVIRLGRFRKVFSKFKSAADLESIKEPLYKERNASTTIDISWFEQTYKYWMAVLNNHNDLFFTRKLEDNYRIYSGSQGIKFLINGGGSNDLVKTWQKIIAEIKK